MSGPARSLRLAAGVWIIVGQVSVGWGQAGALNAAQTNAIDAPGAPALGLKSAHTVNLPHFEPELAVAPGRDDFLAVCVSCHSPRYVTMQPPFAPAQWEATVEKMATAYGAQIEAKQKKAVAAYLVATHGPAAERVPARDDDFTTAVPQLPTPLAAGPPLSLASDPAARAAQIQRGTDLFQQDCAGCHGTAGRGDGFVGQVLWRKPKDLASTRFSLTLLGQVLWNGKRGTAMPSWRGLPQPDLAALAAYVQSLHPPSGPDRASPKVLEQGSKLFVQNCAPCHGISGDGKGTAAANLLPEPANFKLKQPDSDYLLQVLSDGIPGTAMPAWKNQISESDRRALAGYVRSLFQ